MENQKKVLIIASVASMIDQFNMPNIKLLIDMGYEVHVACNFIEGSTCSDEQIEGLKSTLESLNVNYYQIDFKRNVMNVQNNVVAYKQVLGLMKQNKYEFAHCHSPIAGVIGRLVGKVTKTKVIYTAHGFHFFKGAPVVNWLVYYPIEKWLSRYTDVLITINKEDYERAKGFKAKTVEYVPGVGIDVNKFTPQTFERKNELRQKLGYRTDDFILIYVGELSYRKHQDLLITAISLLKKDIPNIKLLLVGKGDYYDKYVSLIDELNVKEQIHLLGYRSDVPELMGLSDVVVSSSRQEGLPVNVMEAMATGLPLVVSNCRGNGDLVKDGKNGFVVGIDDADGFAESVRKFYESEELRKEFSKKSLEMVEEYSIENILNKMGSVYKQYLR